MLTKILKIMAILILLPVLAMCTAVSLEIYEGAKEGYEQAEAEAEANKETI